MSIGDQTQKPEESGRKRGLNWVRWWQTDQAEIDEQARLYDAIGFRNSWRGWAVLCLALNGFITVVMAAVSAATFGSLLDVAVMAILALFIYRGHRWAMIGAMILCTIEKVFWIAAHPDTAVTAIIWWGFNIHVFYNAFRVEQRRRNMPAMDPAIFN